MSPTGIEKLVCEDIARRQALGIAKYGTTVADNPLELRDWMQHAYEETLDKAVYLKRAIEEMDRTRPPDNSNRIYNPLVNVRYSGCEIGAEPIYPGEPGYADAPYETVFLQRRK